MKTCFKCGILQPLSNFYRHAQMADGYLNKCKSCARQDVQKNYAGKREQYSEYERERFKRPSRKVYISGQQRKARAANPEKYKARTAVSNALRDGRLIRQPCKVCGAKAQAHHHDYSKPLEVEWLCFTHHREEHGQTVTQRNFVL